MGNGSYFKILTCMLSLLGKWETSKGTVTVDGTDLLIIGQIYQYTGNGKRCYISDSKLAELTGKTDKSTIQKRLKKLESLGIIKRTTFTEEVKGKEFTKREMTVLKLTRDEEQIDEEQGYMG